jgi:hypothetical protein
VSWPPVAPAFVSRMKLSPLQFTSISEFESPDVVPSDYWWGDGAFSSSTAVFRSASGWSDTGGRERRKRHYFSATCRAHVGRELRPPELKGCVSPFNEPIHVITYLLVPVCKQAFGSYLFTYLLVTVRKECSVASLN